MKALSTVVVGTLLAIGLAGNAAAVPSQHSQDRGAKKVVVQETSKKATKKVAQKKVAQKQVAKKTVKKQRVKTYTVRRGDTLSRIAARNNTSVKQLMKLNGLSGKRANNLRVGMKIRVS